MSKEKATPGKVNKEMQKVVADAETNKEGDKVVNLKERETAKSTEAMYKATKGKVSVGAEITKHPLAIANLRAKGLVK